MRIAIIISTLGCGGAERVVSLLANYWASGSNTVAIFCLDESEPWYELDPTISVQQVGPSGSSKNIWEGVRKNTQRVLVIHRTLKQFSPDIVLSFMTEANVVTLIGTRFLKVPVIVSERTVPGFADRRLIWSSLRNILYRFSSRIVVQSADAKGALSKTISAKTVIIGNPIYPALKSHFPKKERLDSPQIVSVGRFTAEKRFDLLLEALAKVVEQYPKTIVTVYGDGPLRATLEAQVHRLGLTTNVCLYGRVLEPRQLIADADMFVLCSDFEGFPNAVCEALAAGLPVIVADCPGGVKEIIEHETNGLLFRRGDSRDLAKKIFQLCEDVELRYRLTIRAPEVVNRFGPELVFALWDQVIHDSCHSG